MKLVFVNIMHDLYGLDSTAFISQPPVPLVEQARTLGDRVEEAMAANDGECSCNLSCNELLGEIDGSTTANKYILLGRTWNWDCSYFGRNDVLVAEKGFLT